MPLTSDAQGVELAQSFKVSFIARGLPLWVEILRSIYSDGRPGAETYDHIKPGLRGRYRVQVLYPGVAIKSIGNVMRMPSSTARHSALSHVPGRNADIFSEDPSAATVNAVMKASRRTSASLTARGPTCPPELI